MHAINTFLIGIKDKVKTITDEEFEVQKSAVATKLAEKDLNLGQEAARLWSEISTHSYLFERQEKELEVLKEITK